MSRDQNSLSMVERVARAIEPHKYVKPRHVSLDLIHQLCGLSLKKIGRYFGRDHTSIMYAIDRAPHWMQRDWRLAAAHSAVIRVMEKGEPL